MVAAVDLRGCRVIWEGRGSSREERGKCEREGQRCNSGTGERERGAAALKTKRGAVALEREDWDFVWQEGRSTCAA